MKINEVEKATGITCANIRYYERKALLVPERGNENNYRVYNSDDIERLKQIKILRMMGIPIADIKDIFAGNLDLKTTMSQRINLLEEEEKNIVTVKNLCQTVIQYDMELSMLNEELLMENVELWQQKLSHINLEEKANILNRKVSIVLCVVTIFLCFFPIVSYNGYLCNIIQLFLLEDLTNRVDMLIPMIAYLSVPLLYTYILYCHLYYKYSLDLITFPAYGVLLGLLTQFRLVSSMEHNLANLLCLIIIVIRSIPGLLLAINYASGDAFYIWLLKRRTT